MQTHYFSVLLFLKGKRHYKEKSGFSCKILWYINIGNKIKILKEQCKTNKTHLWAKFSLTTYSLWQLMYGLPSLGVPLMIIDPVMYDLSLFLSSALKISTIQSFYRHTLPASSLYLPLVFVSCLPHCYQNYNKDLNYITYPSFKTYGNCSVSARYFPNIQWLFFKALFYFILFLY